MSTYVSVEISPDTTIRPVLTSVSHATRPYGSSASTASSTPSEIWSAILSGCPSVTDSDVNRNSLSESSLIAQKSLQGSCVVVPDREGGDSLWQRRALPGQRRAAAAGAALAALDEVDDQRDPLQPVARAQPVLDEVGVVARHTGAGVDLDRKAGRTLRGLGHVDQLQPVPGRAAPRAHRRLPRLHGLCEEAVELRRGYAPCHAITQRDRLAEQARDVPAALRTRREHPRAQAQPFGHAFTRAPQLLLAVDQQVPLVEHDQRRAS